MAWINKGEQITYPDGRPYCKAIRDIHGSDPPWVIPECLGEYEEGAPLITSHTELSAIPFISSSLAPLTFNVNGQWR